MRRGYDFVCENGFYTINLTGYPQVGVWGVGSTDRKEALKQAKHYCKTFPIPAKLTIKCQEEVK